MVDFSPSTGRRGILPQPGVNVYQIFGEVAPTIVRPLLEACVIGESYQIEMEALAGLYAGAETTYSYPGLLAGAEVIPGDTVVTLDTVEDTFDITAGFGLTITDTSVTVPASVVPTKTLVDHQQATNVTGGNTLEDPNAAFVADNIRPGDLLTFETSAGSLINIDSIISSANTVTFTVLNVLSDTELELNPVLVTEPGKFEYSIDRAGSSAGEVNITFRALRTDGIGTVYEVEDLEDLEAQLGTAIPENPLAFGMSLALQNTINIVAGTPVENQDSVSDHQAATELLESWEVYALAPMTQNPSVFQVYEQHIDQSSEPCEKHERVVFINQEIDDYEVFQTQSTTGATDGSDGTLFDDANGEFITNEVPVGAVIKLSAPIEFPTGSGTFTDELQIAQVISEIQVKLIDDAGTGLGPFTYTVQSKAFTKLQQARRSKEFAESFNNRRVISIVPDEIEVAVEDGTQWVPGYFLGAIYAGLTSGTTPSQGFTNLSVAGVIGLRHANKYFSVTQMGTMAAGGVWVEMQESDDGPVFSRHQLTTAVGTIETREYSIVKAVDYAAKFFRSTMKNMIGVFNITQDFIDNQVWPAAQGVIRDLIEEGVIGEGTHITGIEQDKSQPDNVNIYIAFEVLFPCNYLNVILYI